MNLVLSPESMAWLKAKIQSGQFVSYEEAIDYSVRLTALRETLLASLADPRRYSLDEVRANLKAHFAAKTGR
jgi:Arc/MetJ-type ribon-helix-helix transcriptional regulator